MNLTLNQSSERRTLTTSSKSRAALAQGFLPLDPSTWGVSHLMPFDTSLYQPETTSEPVQPYLFIGTPYGSANFKPNYKKAKTIGISLGIAVASTLILYISFKIYLSRRTTLRFPIPNLTNVNEDDEGELSAELDSKFISGGSGGNMSSFYVHNAAYSQASHVKRGAIKVDNSKGLAKVFMRELELIMTKPFPFRRHLLYVTKNSYIYTDWDRVYGVRMTDDGLEAKFLCTKASLILDPNVKLDDADSVFKAMLRKYKLCLIKPYLQNYYISHDIDGKVVLGSKPFFQLGSNVVLGSKNLYQQVARSEEYFIIHENDGKVKLVSKPKSSV